MKDLKNLVNSFQNKPVEQGSHQLQNNIPPVVKQLVDQVFKQLKIICPAYDHALPTEQTVNDCKKEWVKAFFENDVNTVELVKSGLMGVRKSESDFLPSCGKFISWCKPSPENMGWPSSNEALKKCIEFRSNKKLFGAKAKYCRPMIIELCKKVDWWLMNNANNQVERKKADNHFLETYMELLNSGYVEPEQTDFDRLPTQETVKAGMSDQQKADKQKRDLDHIKNMKKKLKQARYKL